MEKQIKNLKDITKEGSFPVYTLQVVAVRGAANLMKI